MPRVNGNSVAKQSTQRLMEYRRGSLDPYQVHKPSNVITVVKWTHHVLKNFGVHAQEKLTERLDISSVSKSKGMVPMRH